MPLMYTFKHFFRRYIAFDMLVRSKPNKNKETTNIMLYHKPDENIYPATLIKTPFLNIP